MSHTWRDEAPAPVGRIGAGGFVRMLWRAPTLALLNFGCLALLLTLRLVERPLFGLRRPVTPHITRFVCRNSLRILGIRHQVHGQPMKGGGAMVANHSSWLDIYVLNAPAPIYFVSKAEVANWPGIGWLARATGTVFIRRDRREARQHNHILRERLAAGHQLLFFPEGTSTDGQRVLPFKTTLFEAFLAEGLRERMQIQPVTVVYHAPPGEDRRFYAWWGDMDFGSHLLKLMACGKRGRVEVIYHPPVRAADYPDRKALARALEETVRSTHARHLPEPA